MKKLKTLSAALILAFLAAAGGLAVSQPYGPGPSNFLLALTDGVNTIANTANALRVTFSGCTVGGSSSNATVSCSGGGGSGNIATNNQTAHTTYPVNASDNNTEVTLCMTDGSAIAVTLPQAGTTGFATGWNTLIHALPKNDSGVACTGTVTVTPATSKFNGATSQVLTPGMAMTAISDGTNYHGRVSIDTGGGSGTGTVNVASGAKALATGAIASGACTAAQTAAAAGTLTTDVATASFSGDPTGITGFIPATTGMLTIIVYPTVDTVNFKECNLTSASITPGAHTVNWKVVR